MSWNKDTTTLLSLDTSSSKTGWAVFEDGKYKESGVYDWSHIKNTEDRLQLMYIEIIQNIDKYEPDILVIEKDVVGSGKKQNISTINTLVKLIGGVWAYQVEVNMNCPIEEPKIFYMEYSPSEWRKLIGIKGRKREEYKNASIKNIKEIYNLDVDDNEADAINIGLAYIKDWGEN